jgi:hypothetical protein
MPSQMNRTALGSRVAVTFVFSVLALSFVLETAVMVWEYRSPFAMPMAAFDGHLFLFFPTFGIVALMAFRRAAILLVDAYWRFIKGGKLILLAMLLVMAAISALLTISFQRSPNRQWWEVAKPVLLADTGEPAGCTPPGCTRAPVVEAYNAVRLLARTPHGLTGFYEACENQKLSPFVPQLQQDEDKFCFVTGKVEAIGDCCKAKARFKQSISDMHAKAPSLTYYAHAAMLPLKAFFLLMLLALGGSLAWRRVELETHYPLAMKQVERTIPIGAASMMIWPLMNQAYELNFDLLYGSGQPGAFRMMAPIYTIVFAAWVAVLLFYYFRRYEDSTVGAAKVIGALLAGLSVFNFDTIMAAVTRYIGAGANLVSFGVALVALAFLVYETLFNPEDLKEVDETESPARERKAPLLAKIADLVDD